jgi:hypothetical protein
MTTTLATFQETAAWERPLYAFLAETEKQRLLSLMLESVFCDVPAQRVMALQPRVPFVPVLSVCDALVRIDGPTGLESEVAGDPEGIRTLDLHRDRVAC